MGKNFSVDSTLFKAKAKKLVKQLKLDESTVVKEEAGMMAQTLAKMTPPFETSPKMKGLTYGTKKDEVAGVKATRAGFYSVVKLMTKNQGWKNKSIRAAIVRGDTAAAQAILERAKKSKKKNLNVFKYTDNQRNKRRDNRGRAGRDVVPFVALSDSDAAAGLKRAIGNVGIAKAHMAKIAVRLGRKMPIKFIKRHLSKVSVSVQLSRNPARVRFSTKSHGLDVAARRLKEVERFRLKALVLKLNRLVRADAKKAGFKTR